MAHEHLKTQYEKDAAISPNAHLVWQFKHDNTEWETCYRAPKWCAHNQYRRHPHADLILTYDRSTVYEFQAADKPWQPWQTVSNPPLWDDKLNYRKKPMAHEHLKRQYEADKLTYNEPHLLWEYNHSGRWGTMQHEPRWDDRIQYRRKPEARPHAHLIKLWAEGSGIQRLSSTGEWVDTPYPSWKPTRTYRETPATQTRFIPVLRMPAGSVYVGEGKITPVDCKPSHQDTLISVLEISVSANDTVTLVKEHRV